MTGPATASNKPGNIWLSIAAVVAGFFLVAVLSEGTDGVLRAFGVFPPRDQPMPDTMLLLAASAYRAFYAVAGCFLAARLAPRAPMRHALILGGIGFVVSSLGVLVAIKVGTLGPLWYPVSLVVTALPAAWLGGRIAEGRG